MKVRAMIDQGIRAFATILVALFLAVALAMIVVPSAFAQAESSNDDVTGFTPVSTGGFPPEASSARNLVIIVRFAGDTIGEGETGYNEPYTYREDIRTQWEHLIKEFNEPDRNAYVKLSFRSFLATVSGGLHDVVTDFPQTKVDGTVAYLTLPQSFSSYENNGDYSFVRDALAQFNEAYPFYDGRKLDLGGDGFVDNVLIIPSIPEDIQMPERSSVFWSHKANLANSGLYIGSGETACEVGDYNIINTRSLEIAPTGVAAHEYLHTLGTKDYYRESGKGDPVGVWDIMASSQAPRSWPLAVTRRGLGWTSLPEKSASGTYTLYEAGTNRDQALMFKSPLSDTEYFVVEYRRKGSDGDMASLDRRIGGSGIVVYRVNSAFAAEGNIAGHDYVYLFRPGETGLGDAAGDVTNAQIAMNGPRTSIGTADFSQGITDGALCYSDGRNSGIVIEATAQSDDSLTFTLTYPDYAQADLWDDLGGPGGSLASNADYVELVSDGADLYALVAPSDRSAAYQVLKCEDGVWSDFGLTVRSGLLSGHLAARGGVVCFAAADALDAMVVKTCQEGTWRDAVVPADVRANSPTIGFIGSTAYVLADNDNADARLYKLEGGKMTSVGPALSTDYCVAPAVFELNGNPAVAYGDFDRHSGSQSKSVVCELVEGKWVERSSFAGCSHVNSVAQANGATYVYQHVDASVNPRMLSFLPDGSLASTTELAQFKPCTGGGDLAVAGDRLYLAVVAGDGSNDPARVFSAALSDLSVWKQLGADAYSPAISVSAAVWEDRIVAGAVNASSRVAVIRSHALMEDGSVDPPSVPGMLRAVFKAGGRVVDTVEFKTGDTALERVPAVPSKEGYTGSWSAYSLGTSDIVVEAVYEPNEYRVTFKDWDGTVLSSRDCLFGSSVQQPSAPTRAGSGGVAYVFAGWSPSFSGTCDHAGDVTYVAQYATQRLSVQVAQRPADLTYGYLDAAPFRLTVKNEGTAMIENVVADFDNGSAYFVLDSSSLRSLNPGQSVTVNVRPKTGLFAGLHTVTVRVRSGSNMAVSATCSFMQNVRKLDISKGALYERGANKPGVADRAYTGRPQVLAEGWKVMVGGTTVPTSQLSIAYENNTARGDKLSAHPPKVKVAATGANVSGSLNVAFTIASHVLSAGDVSGIPAQMTYNGTALTPEPTVSVQGGAKLTKGVDYDVSYAGNASAGTGTVTVRGKGACAGTVTKSFKIVRAKAQVSRLAGPIALDTMTAITKEGFAAGSCSTVVVATTSGYWDALTASALAGVSKAPVLLTDGTSLSQQTAAEIRRLGASRVLVAGGSAAVSDNVVAQLGRVSGVRSVARYAGATATGTAIEIFRGSRGWGETAIVATSSSFQDALSIAPYAYSRRAPIFLTEASSGKLSNESLAALRSGGFKRVYVVGGTAAVSSAVEGQLDSLYAGRLWGATAYETSLAIAQWCVGQGMSTNNVGIATGDSYYDALAGAALCGKNNAALVLVSEANRTTVQQFVSPHAGGIVRAYVFGGTAAVSPATHQTVQSALG